MAGSSTANLKSVYNAKRRLQRFLKTLDTVPVQVLEEESRVLYGQILAEVPVSTGKLEESVSVSVSSNRSGDVVGLTATASALSPRGYNYAGIQHENEFFEHTKGKAHYISDPFNDAIKRIKQKTTRRLKIK